MSTEKQDWPDTLLLNGSDYFQLLLDSHYRQYGSQGNISRFAVKVKGRLDACHLEQAVNNDPVFHWLSSLRLKRPFPFRLPRWKQVKSISSIPVSVHEAGPDTQHIPDQCFTQDIQPCSAPPFLLDLVYYPDNHTLLLFSWSHILMDSQGAEVLIRHLGKATGGKAIQLLAAEEIKISLAQQLKHAQKIRDFMFHDGQKTTISLLTDNPCCRPGPHYTNHYHLIRFSEDETNRIIDNCSKKGVQFGRSSFLLAATIHGFHDLLERKGKKNLNIWIPLPQNQRKKGALGPLVGNQLSYLFYRIFPRHLESMQRTVEAIRQQMIDQMRCGIPTSFSNMMTLLRRLPLRLYEWIVKSPTQGALASFFFSDTGKTLDDLTLFCGLPVCDAIHYPPHSSNPGFTIIYMNFHHQLQAIVAHTESFANEEDLSFFETALRKNLFG